MSATLVLCVGLGAAKAHAQDDEQVLHEYFNPWQVDTDSEGGGIDGSNDRTDQTDARSAPNTTARSSNRRPSLSINPGAGEVVYGKDGPVDRGNVSTPYGPLDPASQQTRLDRNTDRVDRLNYYANFEPSIMPYKRGVVQDSIRYDDGDYRIVLGGQRTRSIRVTGGEPRADEDSFWGSFMLRTEPGAYHPLPSVAADQRILTVQTEPDVPVTLFRDQADNYYLRTRHEGLLRLNVHLAAPAFYFDGKLDSDVAWSDFDRDRTPELPDHANDVADDVLDAIGISRSADPKTALEGLIFWYRDFEAKPFPDDQRGEDLYRAVSTSKIGVCRHRSMAFMMSARALGIPTRYVYNEAHAFVEVHWPRQGWRRIDLGGAANDFNFTSRSSESLHEGSFNDRFPQPPRYVEELRRQARQSESDGAEGERASGDAPERAAGETATEPASASEGEGGALEETGTMPDGSPASDGDSDAPSAEERIAVTISIRAASRQAFRGRSFRIEGVVRAESGTPLSGKSVDILLGPVGSENLEDARHLGRARTGPNGEFSGAFAIPKDVSIGRWSVLARFRGDETYAPAVGE